jgi:hypothetical protein
VGTYENDKAKHTCAKGFNERCLLILINAFLSKVTKETSFENQISVIQAKNKIRVIRAVSVRKARIQDFDERLQKIIQGN